MPDSVKTRMIRRMTPMRTVGNLLTALLLALALLPAARAEPIPAIIGGERIVLDTPPGFSDTAFLASPRIQELAESTTSASNRVLLFAITDADLRKFMTGDRPEFRRYMLVVTPRGLERDRVNEAQFAGFVTESMRELGPAAGTQDFRKHLDAQPMGKAALLAELKRQPNVVSVLQGTRQVFEGTGFFTPSRTAYLLATTTLFVLRGKALQMAVYSGYDSPADLEWITGITERWTEELLRLNRR